MQGFESAFMIPAMGNGLYNFLVFLQPLHVGYQDMVGCFMRPCDITEDLYLTFNLLLVFVVGWETCGWGLGLG
jgi:hypothetical protein